MKKVLRRVLLLTCCLGFWTVCGCSFLEKKITVVETDAQQETEAQQAELGPYWYGYWYLTDAGDEWRPLDGYSWDCCGQLSSDGDALSMLIWDENMPKDYYLARIDFRYSQGSYSCTGGEFLDISLGREAATIKLEDDKGKILKFSGFYSDDSTGSFYYVIYLRPWGDQWPTGQSRPYYYETWYLPKIEAGEDPPDVINPYE